MIWELLISAVAVITIGVLHVARCRTFRRRLERLGWLRGQRGRRPRRRLDRSVADSLALVGRLRATERWLPVVAAFGVVALIGGPYGVLVGALVAIALGRWLPRVRSPTARRTAEEQDRLTRQLPLTAELLAACLGSGALPGQAVSAVAESMAQPMQGRLAAVAAELALGAPPEDCWERLAVDSPALAPLARCLVRTTVSGSPPTAMLIALAESRRAAASRAAHARIRRAGVLATAPLGVCFLPAFILIGIVPVVMGLTTLFARQV